MKVSRNISQKEGQEIILVNGMSFVVLPPFQT